MTVDGFRAIAGQVVWIGLGAVLGANARYFVSQWLAAKLGAAFPYGTLAVNVSGSLLLGFLAGAGSHYLALPPQLRLMMTVGFLGSFTTFSSFAVESIALWQNGRVWAGLANILANNGVSLVCALLGILLARQFLPCDLCD